MAANSSFAAASPAEMLELEASVPHQEAWVGRNSRKLCSELSREMLLCTQKQSIGFALSLVDEKCRRS
jgi:hypothetical protein